MSQALLEVRTSNFQQTKLLQMLRELLRLWGLSKLPYGVILGFTLQSRSQFVTHEQFSDTQHWSSAGPGWCPRLGGHEVPLQRDASVEGGRGPVGAHSLPDQSSDAAREEPCSPPVVARDRPPEFCRCGGQPSVCAGFEHCGQVGDDCPHAAASWRIHVLPLRACRHRVGPPAPTRASVGAKLPAKLHVFLGAS